MPIGSSTDKEIMDDLGRSLSSNIGRPVQPRPPFILEKKTTEDSEFIMDLEYFVSRIKADGISSRRLNQIKALIETRLNV